MHARSHTLFSSLALCALVSLGASAGCTRTPTPDQLPPNDPARAISCPSGTMPARGVAYNTYTSVWCEQKDGAKQGPYLEWWENGTKKATGQFKDGVRDGRWTFFRENGQIDSNVEYRGGAPVSGEVPPPLQPPPEIPVT
jgi:hypothetical protein